MLLHFLSTVTVENAAQQFKAVYAQDRRAAIVAAFYLRDVRGGLGQRESFRAIMQWLADEQRDVFRLVAPVIPEYGRWDDLIIFSVHHTVGGMVQTLIMQQWYKDLSAAQPSLLAKYLPSESASSEETKFLAHRLIRLLYHSTSDSAKRSYRKDMVRVRARLPIVERLMSARRWHEIDYASVPAAALSQYYEAFMRHDGNRFRVFLTTREKRILTPTALPATEEELQVILKGDRYALLWSVPFI